MVTKLNMRFETLLDLIEAYRSGELSNNVRLCIDTDNGTAYVENIEDPVDQTEIDYEDRCLFYININELLKEALEILEVPIDD